MANTWLNAYKNVFYCLHSQYQLAYFMNTNSDFAQDRILKAYAGLASESIANKYIALYKAIKSCIQARELPNHWVIPSTRKLAEALQLSRTTVLKAYELLQLEKLIVARQGAGYRVLMDKKKEGVAGQVPTLHRDAYPSISEKGTSFLNNISILNRQKETGIAFKPGLPPIDVFPINQWKNLLNLYWRYVKSSELSYDRTTGSSLLKEQICNYLNVSRNIKCQPEQLVVVSGSLQSIYLIASALINKGDSVALEDPTFPNVHSIFKSHLARLLAVDLDDEGIDINALDSFVERPKLVHVTPSDHYPLGVKMSLRRRLQLLQWASKNRALIIENDYEHEIANASSRTPTIFSLDKEDRTIYLGTFNRLLYPSIRLGYMIVPQHLIPVVEALQEHSHRFVSPSIQVVMGQFIDKNYLFQHLRNLTEVAQEREYVFKKAMQETNGALHVHDQNFHSLHLIASFKRPTTVKEERQYIDKLAQHELSAYALSKCYIEHSPQSGLILGFSTLHTAAIPSAVKKFTDLMR